MASRAKSSRSGTPRKKKGASPIDDALARLEREIPKLLRQLRTNMRDLQRQVDRARSDGEKRWREAERKIKQDAAKLRTTLGSAVDRMRGRGKPARKAKPKSPRPARKTTRRKARSKTRRG
jgi:hypothetical protein